MGNARMTEEEFILACCEYCANDLSYSAEEKAVREFYVELGLYPFLDVSKRIKAGLAFEQLLILQLLPPEATSSEAQEVVNWLEKQIIEGPDRQIVAVIDGFDIPTWEVNLFINGLILKIIQEKKLASDTDTGQEEDDFPDAFRPFCLRICSACNGWEVLLDIKNMYWAWEAADWSCPVAKKAKRRLQRMLSRFSKELPGEPEVEASERIRMMKVLIGTILKLASGASLDPSKISDIKNMDEIYEACQALTPWVL